MIPPRGTSCSGPCSPGLAGHLSRSALTTLALNLPPGPGSPHTKSSGPQGPYGTIQLRKGNKKQIQKPKEVPTRRPGQHLSQDSEREFSFPTDAHRVPRRPQDAHVQAGLLPEQKMERGEASAPAFTAIACKVGVWAKLASSLPQLSSLSAQQP